MPKVGVYTHRNEWTGSVAFGNSVATDKVLHIQLHNTGDSNALKIGKTFTGQLQLIRFSGTKSVDTTSITLRACSDTDGKKLLLEPTTGTLIQAVDGSTTYAIVYKAEAWLNMSTDDIYFFISTNAGTFTATEFYLTWIE